MKNVLITGGTGFIGSHTCVEMIAAGWSPVVLDNLSNSSRKALDRVERITGKRPPFVEGDVRDEAFVRRVLDEQGIDAVVHFAGLKAVGESVANPLAYYQNNCSGTAVLLQEMARTGVKRFIFSSSATVYAATAEMPLTETSPLKPSNPYGRTKLVVEDMLRDLAAADPAWNTTILRYFNPVGAHPSGSIGEDPRGAPNNLMPFITQVAIGRQPHLRIFDSDYETPDGTGVRDYIHVVDLAKGHVAALRRMLDAGSRGISVFNLGTGRGHSVLELIRAFESATGVRIPHRFVERRPGDIATCYADAGAARNELGWAATSSIDEMCRDSWNWQKANPRGYE